MSTTSKKLIEKLKASKKYRESFVGSQVRVGIPFQIRALRKQLEWSQSRLAEEASMNQPTISAMEGAGYDGFTLSTLRKLAAAFDVGLIVRFAPFGDLVHWTDHFSPDTFTVPRAVDDPVLNVYEPWYASPIRTQPLQQSESLPTNVTAIRPASSSYQNSGHDEYADRKLEDILFQETGTKKYTETRSAGTAQ